MITGYLGSGKTTVMKELLKNQAGKKIALIVNDMGSINLDADLLKKGSVAQLDTKMRLWNRYRLQLKPSTITPDLCLVLL